MSSSQRPLRYDLKVPPHGRIELQLPLPVASRVTVYVVEDRHEADELLAAATTSTEFWDNPLDDEDWNDA